MHARLHSASLVGVEASLVEVEVDVSFGLPTFTMVGLPDSSVRESRDRVRSAIRNSEFEFPARRITINLAPADVRKRGTSYDLPIAVGVLAASGQLSRRDYADVLFLGELSLDGSIQPTRGVLPMALVARRRAMRLFAPHQAGAEVALVPGLSTALVASLRDVVEVLEGRSVARAAGPARRIPGAAATAAAPDMSEGRGQQLGRRALEVAAAGRHNLLLVGPPGGGKTMMARRLPGILPPLSLEEAIETSTIHSVFGRKAGGEGLANARPFRAPHHSISDAALIGGGREPRPGEASLSHNGVLFLDEIPEFDRRSLEALRQPLEEGIVRVARAAGVAIFPARFLLVAAMNPCPCGHAGDPSRECRCTPTQVTRYHGRLSGPLRDRLDLIVPVNQVPVADLLSDSHSEASAEIRHRVTRARDRQTERYGSVRARTNGDLTRRELGLFCQVGDDEKQLLSRAISRFRLSARGYDRVRRVARTLADLDDSEAIRASHVTEALAYRGIRPES